MTYGGHYSRKAKGAINRFYEHADTRNLTQAQELVTELFLAQGPSADKLWKKAGEVLTRLGVSADRSALLVAARDVKALAQIVADLAKPGPR
jgi:hypothetical protein